MPPTDAAGWFQQTLEPPDRVQLTFVCHIVAPADTVAVTCSLFDGPSGTLAGIQSRGFGLDPQGLTDAALWIGRVIKAGQERCTTF